MSINPFEVLKSAAREQIEASYQDLEQIRLALTPLFESIKPVLVSIDKKATDLILVESDRGKQKTATKTQQAKYSLTTGNSNPNISHSSSHVRFNEEERSVTTDIYRQPTLVINVSTVSDSVPNYAWEVITAIWKVLKELSIKYNQPVKFRSTNYREGTYGKRLELFETDISADNDIDSLLPVLTGSINPIFTSDNTKEFIDYLNNRIANDIELNSSLNCFGYIRNIWLTDKIISMPHALWVQHEGIYQQTKVKVLK